MSAQSAAETPTSKDLGYGDDPDELERKIEAMKRGIEYFRGFRESRDRRHEHGLPKDRTLPNDPTLSSIMKPVTSQDFDTEELFKGFDDDHHGNDTQELGGQQPFKAHRNPWTESPQLDKWQPISTEWDIKEYLTSGLQIVPEKEHSEEDSPRTSPTDFDNANQRSIPREGATLAETAEIPSEEHPFSNAVSVDTGSHADAVSSRPARKKKGSRMEREIADHLGPGASEALNSTGRSKGQSRQRCW